MSAPATSLQPHFTACAVAAWAQATCACALPLWPTCSVTHPVAQALTFCLDCGFVLANEQLDISVAFGEDGKRSGVRVSGNDDGTGAGGVAHAA